MNVRSQRRDELTYTVYCHVCKHGEDRVPRNRARAIGSPQYGWLWHCEKHQSGADCQCPHGEGTESPSWWTKIHSHPGANPPIMRCFGELGKCPTPDH